MASTDWSNRTNLLIFKMLILRMKPLSVAVLEGEGRRELEHYNTEQVVSDFEPHRVCGLRPKADGHK